MSKKFFTGLFASVFLLTVFSFASSMAQAQYSACCPQPGYDYAPYYADCDPGIGYAAPAYANHVFYGRLESVFWNFEGANKRPLIMRTITPPGRSIFTGDDIDYGTMGAPRVVLGLNVTPHTSFEGVYMGFHHAQTYDEFSGGNLSLPGALPTAITNFFLASTMGVSSEADLHSAEFNIVRRTRVPYISWLAGFRYINFEEKIDLFSIPFDDFPDYGEYRVQAKNELYGGQLGVKSEIPITDRFGLQFLGKAGVFHNRASQSSIMDDYTPPTLTRRSTSAESKKTSFVGEVNVGGYVKISENVQLVGGYNFMWLSDIARGADQMDFTYLANSGRFLETDSMLLHGANVGVEMRF